MRKTTAAACVSACLFTLLASTVSAQQTNQIASDQTGQAAAPAQDAPAPTKTKMSSQQKVALAVGAFAAIMKAVQDAKAATPAAGANPATPAVQP